MAFETKHDVLQWYEKQERTLTDEFIRGIPWNEVKNYELKEQFIPVLLYMRDVETLTDMYHRELLRTPTGRDSVISKFMERWGVEEITHGEVINRFLNELGYHTDPAWQAHVRRAVTTFYNANTYLLTTITNLFGRKFTATHMAYGAIHEMTTAQAYRRMMELADHPILTMILKAIIREEAAHTQFYWSVARIELRANEFARRVARSAVENFWNPVGQGSIPKKQTEYVIRTLFGDDGGIDILDTMITKRVQQLPGFAEFTTVTERIIEVCSQGGSSRLQSA